jgi:PAS domain S-box-containing protein
MHRLLHRQLKRHYGKNFEFESLSEEIRQLLENVSQTYDEYDKERRHLENTLDLNSKELFAANELIIQKNKNLSALLDERSKLLENRIEENEEINSTLKQYKQAMDEALLVSKIDLSGAITFVNRNFCEKSGYTQEELIGKSLRSMRHPDNSEEFYQNICDTIQSKQIWKGNFANLSKLGKTYYVSATIFPLLNKDGAIIEFMNILQDITEIQQARKKAEELDRAKSEFLANMSHEIRTPMNGMLGFIQILSRSSLDEKQKKYLSIIKSSTDTLLKVINDVLDFSKIESLNMNIELKRMNPFIELENVAALFSEKMAEKNIDYNADIDEKLNIFIKIDIHKVKQVLSNLIGNAHKFTPNNGHIQLIVKVLEDSPTRQSVKFSVKDSGIGVPKERQERIFEAFAQADNSTTRKYGGTGLGLSISSSLVKLMGSELKINSQEGVGSEFFFQLQLEK